MKYRSILRRCIIYLLLLLLLPILLSQSSLDLTSSQEQVRKFTRSTEFDYWSWTIDAFLVKFQQASLNLPSYIDQDMQKIVVLDTINTIHQYHQLEAQINQIYTDPEIPNPDNISTPYFDQLEETSKKLDLLLPIAETIIQNQLSSILAEEGLGYLGQTFPPVLYHITPLPKALITSPRDVIRQDANLSLDPNLSLEEIMNLENNVADSLNVSSLVTDIGGVGTYPTMVMQSSNLTWLIGVVGHEWTHNFLTLRPLGLNYGTSKELRTINETTASISEEELKWAVVERYYPEYYPAPIEEQQAHVLDETETEEDPFDFPMEMYITRTTTDELLLEGKIEEAETYMEERRLFFYENGYLIRRLNQAYFAFHAAYVNAPSDGTEGQTGAAGKDTVGPLVWQLREKSENLPDFLNRISWISSLEGLENLVNELNN